VRIPLFGYTCRLLTLSFHTAGFQPIDLENLVFPAKMYIDYVRVYQRDDAPGIGCSPEDFPTEDYIDKYELFTFCFYPRELTRRQPFECLHEPQSHDMESSGVLLPTQLDIPRLLDSHVIASVSSDSTLFPHERHDMLRSSARVLGIPFVNLVVTERHLPSLSSYATTVLLRHPWYPRLPHHSMMHPLYVSTFKHPCI